MKTCRAGQIALFWCLRNRSSADATIPTTPTILSLAFKNAGHNAGAPIPLPVEVLNSEGQTGSGHYTDPVWDNTRMNNIMDHFVTAYFDYHLKGDKSKLEYFDLVPDGADAVYSMRNGQATENHTYWKGFSAGSAVGLNLQIKSHFDA